MNSLEVIFESERIYFVKISNLLINDYLKMINNNRVSRFLSLKERTYSYDDELNWIKNKLNSNSYVYSMIEKDSNDFIGNIEIMEINDNIVEIAITITYEKQHNHYGTEAIKRFIEYCINDLKLDNVELSVYSHNYNAIECYKKIGFIEYKRDINVGTINNEQIDDIYMKYNKI